MSFQSLVFSSTNAIRMKRFIFLFGILISTLQVQAQRMKRFYTDAWKKVEAFEKQDLPSSASKEAERILRKARAEGNTGQELKAMFYICSYLQAIEDEAIIPFIDTISSAIADAEGIRKALLHSMRASAYATYLGQNRWRLYNRIVTLQKNKYLQTWSLKDFHQTISDDHLAALSMADALKKTTPGSIAPVLLPGNLRERRPTLYDLVVHSALDYFTTGERDINRFTGSFEINDPRYFTPSKDFINIRFSHPDSTSPEARALMVFRDAIAWHLNDRSPDALIDLELRRLAFVHDRSVDPEKDEQYARALYELAARYAGLKASAQVRFVRASLAHRLAADAERSGRPDRNAYKQIEAECTSIISRHSGSEGALNAAELLQTLHQRELSLQVEQMNIPKQDFRCRIAWRNVSDIHYRIIPVNDSLQDLLTSLRDKEYWQRLISLPFSVYRKQTLPRFDDLQSHSAEMRVEGLPVGRYILLASPVSDFSGKEHPTTAATFHVTRISWINRGNDGFVLDRETGAPLSVAKMRFWQYSNESGGRRNFLRLVDSAVTDLNGYFPMPIPDIHAWGGFKLEAEWNGDRVFPDFREQGEFPDNRSWISDRAEYENRYRRLYLFTDRSIYRPGQTVYFKGLLVTRDADTRLPKLESGREMVISLSDANGQESDSVHLRTGEYGSLHGSFKLPERGLTGSYRISDRDYGSISIQVEEYKRPTFEVTWKADATTFRVYDTVRTSGLAQTYAGAALNNAAVSYRVQRVPRYPYSWLWHYYGWGEPPAATVEIAHGNAITDASGNFQIRFPANPDKSIDPKLLPVFDYLITADVTDINGETRSGEQTISVGYHRLNLEIITGTQQTWSNDADAIIEVKSSNLSGTPLTVTGRLALLPLKSPQRLIRPRLWAATDTFLMSETEYIRYFPHDEYAQETRPESWPTGTPAFRHTDTLRNGSARVSIPLKGLTAGWYRIELTALDSLGSEITTRRDFRVSDAMTGLSGNALFSVKISDQSVQPGDNVSVTIASADSSLHLIELLNGYQGQPQVRETGRKTPQRMSVPEGPGTPYRFFELQNAPRKYSLPVTEADRGGFALQHAFVRHNRMYSFESMVAVPWSNKELDIRVETWRDRTMPGSAEEWSVNVRGSKGEFAAAEMLLSMYDASLDQFRGHAWDKPDLFDVYPVRFDRFLQRPWSSNHFRVSEGKAWTYEQKWLPSFHGEYERFIWKYGLRHIRIGRYESNPYRNRVMKMERRPDLAYAAPPQAEALTLDSTAQLNETVVVGKSSSAKKSPAIPVKTRKDFRETAFFFPDLHTDSLGNIRFKFTMPEALTRWKWQMLAHTKDLAMATATRSILTQKDLMVQANTPRFLREGDLLSLPVKVTNLTDAELSGQVTLEIIDTETGNPVDGYFHNVFPAQYFTAPAKQSTAIPFTMRVPGNYNKPVTFRISARSGRHTDGEERTLPVLTDRILVTESMPMRLQGIGSRSYQFKKLAESDPASSLTHHRLTAEWSTNPSWYAVESLPYLTTYPYDCAEQSFNKFYANAVAHRIVSTSPAIRKWMDKLSEDTTGKAFKDRLTPLTRNPELKGILLEESPWVLDGRAENRQRRDIRNLFDQSRLSGDLDYALSKVMAAQTSNGGFSWFHDGPDDRYMTQYILTGFARLKAAEAIPAGYEDRINNIVTSGITYLQKRMAGDLALLQREKVNLDGDIAGDLQVQCLYTLSGFPGLPIEPEAQKAYDIFRRQAARWWPKRSRQVQAMTALMLHRTGDTKTAKAILKSLKEYAIRDSILGMYWKYDGFRGYWTDAPVETQALLIQAFAEIDPTDVEIDRMREWLLTQKQTNRWESTRATAEACHALLMTGSDWLAADRKAEIRLGTSEAGVFKSREDNGVGYLKGAIEGEQVKAGMGNVQVTVSGTKNKENSGLGWGAVYWQYFEHMDRITASASPMGLVKEFFMERKTDRGPVLEPVREEDDLKVGDKLVVRITLRTDRDLEYVHLKDLRASGTEPVNVISEYHWKGGLGWYESTRDAATNFFFQFIPKGTHVFDYPMFVSHNGRFSAGIATVECMYAPEFRAHSDGKTLRVK